MIVFIIDFQRTVYGRENTSERTRWNQFKTHTRYQFKLAFKNSSQRLKKKKKSGCKNEKEKAKQNFLT